MLGAVSLFYSARLLHSVLAYIGLTYNLLALIRDFRLVRVFAAIGLFEISNQVLMTVRKSLIVGANAVVSSEENVVFYMIKRP